MTEYTPKLGFPIPAVTRGGDVNDVQDITDTIGQILDYIDAGTGGWLVGMWSGSTSIDASTQTAAVDLGGSMIVPPHSEGWDPAKIGWVEGADSAYAQINLDDFTATIKKGGTYRIFLQTTWSTEATEGGLALGGES